MSCIELIIRLVSAFHFSLTAFEDAVKKFRPIDLQILAVWLITTSMHYSYYYCCLIDVYPHRIPSIASCWINLMLDSLTSSPVDSINESPLSFFSITTSSGSPNPGKHTKRQVGRNQRTLKLSCSVFCKMTHKGCKQITASNKMIEQKPYKGFHGV